MTMRQISVKQWKQICDGMARGILNLKQRSEQGQIHKRHYLDGGRIVATMTTVLATGEQTFEAMPHILKKVEHIYTLTHDEFNELVDRDTDEDRDVTSEWIAERERDSQLT